MTPVEPGATGEDDVVPPEPEPRSPLREPFGLEPSSNAVILPFPRSDAGVSEKKARER